MWYLLGDIQICYLQGEIKICYLQGWRLKFCSLQEGVQNLRLKFNYLQGGKRLKFNYLQGGD